jgi:hypothetical protein
VSSLKRRPRKSKRKEEFEISSITIGRFSILLLFLDL